MSQAPSKDRYIDIADQLKEPQQSPDQRTDEDEVSPQATLWAQGFPFRGEQPTHEQDDNRIGNPRRVPLKPRGNAVLEEAVRRKEDHRDSGGGDQERALRQPVTDECRPCGADESEQAESEFLARDLSTKQDVSRRGDNG